MSRADSSASSPATWVWGTVAAICAVAALACAAPAPDPDPAAQEVWQPSEEWLQISARDQAVRDLLAQVLEEEDRERQLELYDQYRAAKAALEDWIIQNPDADVPCATLSRFAPPEMRQDRLQECY